MVITFSQLNLNFSSLEECGRSDKSCFSWLLLIEITFQILYIPVTELIVVYSRTIQLPKHYIIYFLFFQSDITLTIHLGDVAHLVISVFLYIYISSAFSEIPHFSDEESLKFNRLKIMIVSRCPSKLLYNRTKFEWKPATTNCKRTRNKSS